MTKAITFTLFLATIIGVYSSMHFLVYSRICTGLNLQSGPRFFFRITIIAFALSFLAAEFLARFRWSIPLLYIGYIWLGMVSLAFSVYMLEWVIHFFWKGGTRKLAWPALCITLVLGVVSLIKEWRLPTVTNLDIVLPKLSKHFDRFRLIQLSDLHIGSLTSPRTLERLVDRVNGLTPDLIVITGDLIDRDICQDQSRLPTLAKLSATHGVYIVSGNHEYYGGYDRFKSLVRTTGIRILHNRMVEIDGGFQLAGVPDEEARRFHLGAPNLEKALFGHRTDIPLILLRHRPIAVKEASAAGVDLQLSGHTHAGQIPPLDLLVWLMFRYPFGLHRFGDMMIYTTFGTGTWGPPMRLFSHSEIVCITLRSPEQTELKRHLP